LSAAGHLLGQASHRVTDGQSVTSYWEIEDAVLVTDCLWTDRIYLETGHNLQTAGLAASPSKVTARPLENYGVKVKAANLQDLPRDWLQLASSRASAGRVGASSAGGGTASCVGRSPLGWPPRPGLGSLVRLPLCGIRAGGPSPGEAAWRADASEVSAWWGWVLARSGVSQFYKPLAVDRFLLGEFLVARWVKASPGVLVNCWWSRFWSRGGDRLVASP
jgi:hypothetical protein